MGVGEEWNGKEVACDRSWRKAGETSSGRRQIRVERQES